MIQLNLVYHRTELTQFIFFYENGVIVKDSVIEQYNTYSSRVNEYTKIDAQKIRIREKEVVRNGGAVVSSMTGNVYIENNIGNQVRFMDSTIFITGHIIIRNFNSTYDNQTNPLKRIALKYPFNVIEEVTEYFPPEIAPLLMQNEKNNRLQKSNSINAGSTTIHTFSYEYNSHGLPILRRDPADIKVCIYQYGL